VLFAAHALAALHEADRMLRRGFGALRFSSRALHHTIRRTDHAIYNVTNRYSCAPEQYGALKLIGTTARTFAGPSLEFKDASHNIHRICLEPPEEPYSITIPVAGEVPWCWNGQPTELTPLPKSTSVCRMTLASSRSNNTGTPTVRVAFESFADENAPVMAEVQAPRGTAIELLADQNAALKVELARLKFEIERLQLAAANPRASPDRERGLFVAPPHMPAFWHPVAIAPSSCARSR